MISQEKTSYTSIHDCQSIEDSIEIDIIQRYLRSRAETEIGSEKKEISKAVSVKEKERPG